MKPLTDNERAIVLMFQGGHSVAQVAEWVGMLPLTIERILRRALKWQDVKRSEKP